MKLYQLSEDYQALYDFIDSIDLTDDNAEKLLTAGFDTLEGIEGEFCQKAANVALFVKQLSALADAIKEEKLVLAKRQSQAEKKTERLKEYLLNCMQQSHLAKIDGDPRVSIRLRNNAESVVISDISAVMSHTQYIKPIKYTEDNINKTAVKKDLQNGIDIEGAQLEHKTSVIIQ